MNYTKPDYYKDFVCIATDCPDTCCANWQIVIDEESMERFKSLEGPFGNRVKNSIDFEQGVFMQYERQCTFLNEDKLCDMYVETGSPDVMCDICKTYPRHREEFTSQCDVMLSMSCPEVARMILTAEAPATFTTVEQKEETLEELDHCEVLYEKLAAAREVMFSLLQNREQNIHIRMSLVLALANDIQLRIDNEELDEIDTILSNYQEPKRQQYLIGKILENEEAYEEVFALRKHALEQLQTLHHLNPNWSRNLEDVYDTISSMKADEYAHKKTAFRMYMSMDKEGMDYDVQREQLMVYFLFHYYCGAAYDEQEFAKVKYAVVSTMLIEELVFALWLENDLEVMDEDIIDLAYQYSREVEHLDDNYLEFEKALIEQEEFRLANLLVSVMGEESIRL